MDEKTRKQFPTTSPEEIEQYRKYTEWARKQMWLTIEAPDGSLVRVTAEEAEKLEKLWHPPVYKGKTLDELVEPSKRLQNEVHNLREQNLSDAEIWEALGEEKRAQVDYLWNNLPSGWSPNK